MNGAARGHLGAEAKFDLENLMFLSYTISVLKYKFPREILKFEVKERQNPAFCEGF